MHLCIDDGPQIASKHGTAEMLVALYTPSMEGLDKATLTCKPKFPLYTWIFTERDCYIIFMERACS